MSCLHMTLAVEWDVKHEINHPIIYFLAALEVDKDRRKKRTGRSTGARQGLNPTGKQKGKSPGRVGCK